MEIKIESKYQIGQRLYRLIDTKFYTYVVRSLDAHVKISEASSVPTVDIIYNLSAEDSAAHSSYRESELERIYFRSKEELIRAVMDQVALD